jgi:hypothetical protein
MNPHRTGPWALAGVAAAISPWGADDTALV